ncbi:MAG: acyltransferase [Lachnospiraceae bacterium]|nr:acyltransferase [Lachnospiraceae bacterium]
MAGMNLYEKGTNRMKSRYQYLDFIRGIAVLLVMYGHLISVGTGALEIPETINQINNVYLPILPSDSHNLWKFDVLLIQGAATESAVTGVFLFFLLTGYLIPDSLKKYANPVRFLINRFFRIFPTLWVCEIIVCIVLYISQGISFSSIRIMSTMFMLYEFFGVPAISGVLWTLSIELFFYILCAILQKFSILKIYAILFITVILIGVGPSRSYYIDRIVTNLKWISIVLCSVTFRLAEKDHETGNNHSIKHILFVPVISFICFNLYANNFGDDSTYFHLGTYLLALSIFFGAASLNKYAPNIFDNPLLKPVYKLAEICLPLYLTHVAVGLPLMYQLKMWGFFPVLIPFIAACISILLAQVIHWCMDKPCKKMEKVCSDAIFVR